MFRTDVKAQIPWPNVNGMFWKWVELVVALPHFLVTVHQAETEDDPDFNTTLIFNDIKDVLAIINEPKNSFEVVRIDLLSPEYLNGSNGFQLGQLQKYGWKKKLVSNSMCLLMAAAWRWNFLARRIVQSIMKKCSHCPLNWPNRHPRVVCTKFVFAVHQIQWYQDRH